MTQVGKDSVYSGILELLMNDGSAGFRQSMETLLNEAMKIERQRYLNAEPYERSEARTDQGNGFKPKQLKTTLGNLSLDIPQVRSSEFYPSCLEKGSRVDRTLLLTMAEMYVQGTSTRKVTKIVEELCGLEVSSMEVSRAVSKLDEVFEEWRTRPIGKIKYLYLDAMYEKVRHGGSVIDCAVLIASGIKEDGNKILLGLSVALSEAEPHWRNFLKSLNERGMHGVELVISDAHSGLKAARKSVFPSIPWQRCQFHLQQNAQSYVPKKSMKKEVASTLRGIFNAEKLVEAERLVELAIKEYSSSAPKLSSWLEGNIHESLTVMNFPQSHRRHIRTSNMLERTNREIRRRTRVATLFPNEKSCERLITAVLMEISDEWETGKRYIKFEVDNE